MTERLLRKKDIAAMLGTSPGVAASILSGLGVQPIDFGAGRGRGARWLESAVTAAIRAMHDAAQPKPAEKRPPKARQLEISLADMPAKELYAFLTNGQSVQ